MFNVELGDMWTLDGRAVPGRDATGDEPDGRRSAEGKGWL
jgi:hypothetical protein